VLLVFTLNIALLEVGAGDLSGAGAALASVTQVGPVVTAIVVSGAPATAMCAIWVPARFARRSTR
jgi:phospholipid/cholesterol/gamma-HCH transport system permease protein